MHISAISTKTSRHETLLPEVFQDLVKAKTPFNVKVNFMGTEFPIPFINGKVANGNVEQSIRNLLKVYFGTVEYEYNMGAIASAS